MQQPIMSELRCVRRAVWQSVDQVVMGSLGVLWLHALCIGPCPPPPGAARGSCFSNVALTASGGSAEPARQAVGVVGEAFSCQ